MKYSFFVKNYVQPFALCAVCLFLSVSVPVHAQDYTQAQPAAQPQAATESQEPMPAAAQSLALAQVLVQPQAQVQNKEITMSTDKVQVHFVYPVLGVKEIDEDLLEWVQQTVRAFLPEAEENLQSMPYELRATYQIVRSCPRVVSVVWNVWTFTGGAHGSLDIVAFTYDLTNNALLELQTMFSDEQDVLNRLSAYTYAHLRQSLGDMYVESMLRSGTSPDLENFATVVPSPDGLRVYFQPYQVAPWAAGQQELDVPLAELMDAGPHLMYWGK